MRYLVRRLLSGALLLVALSALSFVLAELAPGDFLAGMVLDPRISEETIDVLRERYGLDQDLGGRYLAWWRSMLSGELGYSFAYGMPVGRLLAPRLRNTLVLVVPSVVLAWALALLLGTAMAWREGGVLDRLGLVATAALLAIPELVLGLAGLLMAARSGALPTGGMTSLDFDDLTLGGRLGDLALHLALPTAVLVLTSLPVLVRHVRDAVADALAAPFVEAARGHGIPPRRLLWRYALPAAAPPLIPLCGLTIPALLSGSFLVEILFSWPGMGPLLYQATLARDLHVVVGATLVVAVCVILAQLAADLLLFAADPRIADPRADPPVAR